mgnify:CR=1 FL=1
MTTRRKFNVFLFILLLGVFSPLMAQSMSDSQVLEYVKDGIRQGKEQKQLASELARRGVTKEQATRVKQLYEQQNNVNASNATGTDVNESRLREEMKENTSDMLEDHPSTQDLARGNQVFGRNIFNTRNLTFEPSVNIATPLNYRLGPGDEVIIDIWGASQNTIRQQISPDGTINIQKIGPVNLNGLTIAEANDYLKKPFELRELLVRIKALLRNKTNNHAENIAYLIGGYKFDATNQLLVFNGKETVISNIEARILEKLASNIGKTVDASELMIAVWGRDEVSNRNSLHGYIHKLRRAFRHDPNICIINQRGFGYMLTVKTQ